jgi:prepilin-type N-terminal cleavage/methylation domain-containing protein
MKRAFSLIELLTCISILLVLFSITYPVLGLVERNSRRSAAASNLHQLYLAASIYRTDYDGDARYGSPAEMGLPTDTGPWPTPYVSFMADKSEFWRSPCGINTHWFPSDPPPRITVVYRPSADTSYGTYAALYRGNSLLFKDYNCDDPDAPFENQYVMHRGIGVLVEGQLMTPYKPGLMESDEWWSKPQE